WEPYNEPLMESMSYFIKRIPDWEEEDPEFKKYEYIINPGLVMPRPQLAREKRYMPEDLPGIKKTIATLSKSKTEPAKRELSPLALRSQGKGIDIWNPFNPISNFEAPKTTDPTEPAAPPPPPGGVQRITGVQPLDAVGSSS